MGPLPPQHGVLMGCTWRQLPDTDISSKYTE